ncbi:hypothetical protein J2Z44_002497 [Clostridium punense]|uniref:DUF4352 domain-containing protein n=1 Tax=Clostridium punense TaxID=1054297 RepID=A0ABS4K4G2_9CLOT|nr:MULTISPECIES: hypothetical protein [Clostridium]EQB86314.1 hypothetical protein M918_15360 [Clostridium sp. BL8]MBP2022674.1 hypothetical protein [Clostridium punense]
MKKSKLTMLLLVSILLLFGYRYYKVNHNVPLKFTMECYEKGSYADCEGIKVKVVSSETRKSDAKNNIGTEYIDLVVNTEIVNTTAEVKNAMHLIESSMVIEYYRVQTGNLKLDKGDLKNVQPGEKLLLTQVYTLEKEYYEKGIEKDNIYIYLQEKFYPNEIKEKYNEGIRYRKIMKI